MPLGRVVEYLFFFVLLLGAGYLVWVVMSPFITALALALIIVTICYPLYERVTERVWRNNKSLAAAITTFIVIFLIVVPILVLSSIFVKELVSFYQTIGGSQGVTFDTSIATVEKYIQVYLPTFELNLAEQIKQTAEWFVLNLGSIFASTLSTIFLIIISLFGSFYFFRDGKDFVKSLVKLSPLPDKDDAIILSRLGRAVRTVATGVLLVSIIQGISAGLGFTIFGIERAVLWGAVGALLSMIPGIGTMVIMIPAVIYLFLTGDTLSAVGLLVWTITAVIIIDNIISPHLMSRGSNLHPFAILLSVLGGLSVFGPIGFIVGPVVVTLFIVLLEIYNQYLSTSTIRTNRKKVKAPKK